MNKQEIDKIKMVVKWLDGYVLDDGIWDIISDHLELNYINLKIIIDKHIYIYKRILYFK